MAVRSRPVSPASGAIGFRDETGPPLPIGGKGGTVEAQGDMAPDDAARDNGVRDRLRRFVEHRQVQRAITALILINAVTLGLETSATAMAAAGDLLSAIDRIVIAVFVIELSIKLVALGRRFPRDPWNLFDFIVVAISLFPAGDGFAVLRALRVLRVLRLISVVPSMRKVVHALLTAIPGLASIIALLLLIFYVFAVMATRLFGGDFPQWFGTVGGSMFSLFQIMTLESWSMGIVRPVLEVYPYAWAFFVPFILITSFAVLNLFIAIIVNAMQTQHDAEQRQAMEELDAQGHAERERIAAELEAVRREVAGLRASLEGTAKASGDER